MKKNVEIDLKFMQAVFKSALNNKSKLTLSSEFEKVNGWDSLNHIYLVVAIEELFNIKFLAEDIQRHQMRPPGWGTHCCRVLRPPGRGN